MDTTTIQSGAGGRGVESVDEGVVYATQPAAAATATGDPATGANSRNSEQPDAAHAPQHDDDDDEDYDDDDDDYDDDEDDYDDDDVTATGGVSVGGLAIGGDPKQDIATTAATPVAATGPATVAAIALAPINTRSKKCFEFIIVVYVYVTRWGYIAWSLIHTNSTHSPFKCVRHS